MLRPLLADYDHVVIDTHGDLGNLTLSAICAADAVLTVFTGDPGSALGAARVTAFLEQHRTFENTQAQLIGLACSLWDKDGKAAREVLGALEEHRPAAAAHPDPGVPPGPDRDPGQATRRPVHTRRRRSPRPTAR